MRDRLRVRKRWGVIAVVIAVGAGGATWWFTRPQSRPIPRPELAAFSEDEVKHDVAKSAEKVEREPHAAAAWGEYGIVLRAYRQHPQADQCFKTAAELDPADGRWPYLLGHHLSEADPPAAVEWLERAALGTVPTAAKETVKAKLAEVLLAVGRPAQALAVVGEEPESTRTRLVAARAAAAAEDYRSAAEYLNDLVEDQFSARTALLLRAEICRRQGRTSYAEYLAGRASDLPEATWPDPLADPIRSRDLSQGGRLDEASRLLRAGRPAEAERLLRPLTTKPNATDPRPFVGLAEALQELGNRKGAIAALEAAVRVDPKNLAANYQIGLLYFDAGETLWASGREDAARNEFRQAVAWLNQALAVQSDFGKALLLKGAALHRFLGQSDEGIALLRRFVQLRPEAAEGHLLLGQSLAERGQVQEATASLRRAAELASPGDRRAVNELAKLAPQGKR